MKTLLPLSRFQKSSRASTTQRLRRPQHPARTRSDRGRTWSTKQLLRVIKIDRVDVDRHPCASKQVRIVRFARREHGWGGASDAAKEQQLVKGSTWVSREDRT